MPAEDVSNGVIAFFGPFQLDAPNRLLLRGQKPIAIGDRALDLLTVLVENAGQIMGRRELIGRVWPDVVVEEGSLRLHLYNLRKALGMVETGRDT